MFSSRAVKAGRMPGLQNCTWGVVEPLDGSESGFTMHTYAEA